MNLEVGPPRSFRHEKHAGCHNVVISFPSLFPLHPPFLAPTRLREFTCKTVTPFLRSEF